MGKEKRELNPADKFRKEQKKKDIVKSKKVQGVKNEVRHLINDPERIDEEIAKVQRQSDENLLDKSLKDRIKELKLMKSVALKKQVIDANLGIVKSDNNVNSKTVARERENSSNLSSSGQFYSAPTDIIERKPENSIYFHPIHNPSGRPPPGQQAAYISRSKPTDISANPTPPSLQIGGTNGIPLPPPRPPASFLNQQVPVNQTYPTGMLINQAPFRVPPPPPPPPIPSPYMPHPQQFQQYNAFPTPPIPMSAFPSVSNTNQFAKDRKRKVPTAGPDSIDPLDPGAKGFVERFGKKPMKNQQDEEEVNDGQEDNNEEEKLISVPPVVTSYSSAPLVANITFISASSSSSSAPPVFIPPPLPSAEELLRRRNVVQDSSGQGPSLPLMPLQQSSQEGGGQDIFVSLPTPEELLMNVDYYNQPIEEVKTIDPIAPSVSKPSVLSFLGDYGDDEEEEGKEKTVVVMNKTTLLPNEEYDVSKSLLPSNNISIPPPQVSVAVKTLKVIKADSALTAFVPNVLKVKRPTNTSTYPKLVSKPTSRSEAINNQPVDIKLPQELVTKVVPSVDDAYKQFLDELNELGGI